MNKHLFTNSLGIWSSSVFPNEVVGIEMESGSKSEGSFFLSSSGGVLHLQGHLDYNCHWEKAIVPKSYGTIFFPVALSCIAGVFRSSPDFCAKPHMPLPVLSCR